MRKAFSYFIKRVKGNEIDVEVNEITIVNVNLNKTSNLIFFIYFSYE